MNRSLVLSFFIIKRRMTFLYLLFLLFTKEVWIILNDHFFRWLLILIRNQFSYLMVVVCNYDKFTVVAMYYHVLILKIPKIHLQTRQTNLQTPHIHHLISIVQNEFDEKFIFDMCIKKLLFHNRIFSNVIMLTHH